MFVTVILFFAGFYILIKGAGFLVDGASSLAHRLKIPNLAIGLVIAGIGNSIPEFSIAFLANLLGESDIGLGTIIGSNTFNILFILGVVALFFPLHLKPHWVKRDLIFNILAVVIATFFGFWLFNGGSSVGTISRWEGLVLLAVFGAWLYVVLKKSDGPEEDEELTILTLPIAWLMIFGGFVGVAFGAKWVVDGVTIIAKLVGMSETFVGLTLVGIGTSLPELTVSFMAAYKRQPGIAVGNVIGSNIFDFLMILGFSALIKPVLFPRTLIFDASITALSALLLYAAMFIGERHVLKRWQGFVFIVLYLSYFAFLFSRG